MFRIYVLLARLLAAVPAAAAAAQPETLELSMSDAVAWALRKSPAVVAASRRLAAANAEARSKRAMAGLQVSGGLFGGVSSMESVSGGPPGTDPAILATLGQDYAVSEQVAAMLPLYTTGRLTSKIRQAEAEAAAVRWGLEATRASVAASVREAYLRVLLAESRLHVAQADRESAQNMVLNARSEWESGKGIEATYLRALARERSADSDFAMAEAERSKALVELRRALALPADATIRLIDPLVVPKTFASLEAAMEAARTTSPGLLMAAKRLDAAAAAAAAARGSEGPQIYATLMGGWSASRRMRGRVDTSAGVAIGYPLYDGGRRRQEATRARAEAEAAAADAESALLEVEAEVRSAWLDMMAARTARAAAQAASAAARAAYEVIELRVLNQKSILVEQLDALAAVRKAQLDEAQSLFDEALAAVRIDRAVGRY